MAPSTRIPTLVIRRPARLAVYSHNSLLTRFAQPSIVRSFTTAAETSAATPKPSRLRRAFTSTLTAVFFTTLGFTLTMLPGKAAMEEFLTPKSDADTLALYTPATDDEVAHQAHLDAHPLVQALRADPAYAESRPHLKIPGGWRGYNLTAGTLMGPNRVPFPPLAFLDAEGPERAYVQISYAGEELCGHPGIVHGGYLATVLDEGLARTAFAALPSHVGVTANLSVNYRAPCRAGQYLVLRATLTKAEGRKAWVEGRIETLPQGDEKPVVLAEATALYIEPKYPLVALAAQYTA